MHDNDLARSGARPRPDPEKELKVRVPVSLHIKLHTAKVLRGQGISETVKLALEHYFAEHPPPGEAAALRAWGLAALEPAPPAGPAAPDEPL